MHVCVCMTIYKCIIDMMSLAYNTLVKVKHVLYAIY